MSSKSLDQILRSLIVFFFFILIVFTPFIFTVVSEELFEFPKMLFVYGLTTILAGLYLARMITQRQIIFRRTFLDIPIILFVISQILSTVFSLHPQTSIFGYYTRFHGGLLSSLVYIALFYIFVNNFPPHKIKVFLFTNIVVAALVSFYGILERMGVSMSCVMIEGTWGVDCWIQDVQNRVFATFGQPNWLAAYLVTLFPIGLALLSNRDDGKKKFSIFNFQFSMVISLLLMLLAVLFTQSRSGFLGLVAGVGVYLALILINYLRSRNKFGMTLLRPSFSVLRSPVLLFSGLAIGLCLYFGTPFSPSIFNFQSSIFNYSVDFSTNARNDASLSVVDQPNPDSPILITDSGDIRKIVWEGAIKVWQRYPILGSGVETFAYSYYQDRPLSHNLVTEWDFLYNKAHNEFLNYLANSGIIGLASYLVLVGSIIFLPFFLMKNKNFQFSIFNFQLLIAVSAGIIGLSVTNFFGFSTVMVTVLMFILPAISIVLNQKKDPDSLLHNPESKDSKVSSDIYIYLGIIGVVVCYFLLILLSTFRADKFYALGKAYANTDLKLSIDALEQALALSPRQGEYHESYSLTLAKAASTLYLNNQATLSAQIAERAVSESDASLVLNPHHLNFYKSRARVFIHLAELDESFLNEAISTLEYAQDLAPTDAKITFNLAAIKKSQGKLDEAKKLLRKTLEMKPNYEQAKVMLEEMEEK